MIRSEIRCWLYVQLAYQPRGRISDHTRTHVFMDTYEQIWGSVSVRFDDQVRGQVWPQLHTDVEEMLRD
jgi:hypothetical protein